MKAYLMKTHKVKNKPKECLWMAGFRAMSTKLLSGVLVRLISLKFEGVFVYTYDPSKLDFELQSKYTLKVLGNRIAWK